MKICIEFFGQLRFWELQNSILPFVDFFKAKGYEVDILGTFWEDEYSISNQAKNKLDIFTQLQLIPEPNLEPFTLAKYFYSLKESRNQRKNFQSKTNTSYDFIILSRPDIKFALFPFSKGNFDEFKNLVANTASPTVFTFINGIKTHEDKTIRMEDKAFICNVEAANKIGDTYEELIEDKGMSKYRRYHSGLYESFLHFGIDILPLIDFFKTPLYRHEIVKDFELDDGIKLPDGTTLRDYLKKLQNYDDLIDFLKSLKSRI